MKKILLSITGILLIVIGLGLLFYPTLSNWLAVKNQTSGIQEYDQYAADMNAQRIKEELQRAKEYNDALTGKNIEDPFIPGSGMVLPENYVSILNINGIMGYINIPKIDVSLQIRHGTSEEVLIKGVGHLQYTAFPIGGAGTHAVLTGHTGLSSAKLFTDLSQLEIGDCFYISVLNEKLAYEVDQILVVEPNNTEELRAIEGKDYVTLVTCTPYGVNSHRLFVRGIRIPYKEAEKIDTKGIRGFTINWRIVLIVLFFLFLVMAFVIDKYKKRYKKRGRNE